MSHSLHSQSLLYVGALPLRRGTSEQWEHWMAVVCIRMSRVAGLKDGARMWLPLSLLDLCLCIQAKSLNHNAFLYFQKQNRFYSPKKGFLKLYLRDSCLPTRMTNALKVAVCATLVGEIVTGRPSRHLAAGTYGFWLFASPLPPPRRPPATL